MNRFMALTLIAAALGSSFVFTGHEDAAGPVAFIYGLYLCGTGFGWLLEFTDRD